MPTRINYSSQRGFITMTVTIMILVIMSMMALYATNVGINEQRTSANDMRARLAYQSADSGMQHAVEYLKANREVVVAETAGVGWLDPANPLWVRCDPADTTMPCGAEPDPARRGQLYRFVGADGTGILPLSDLGGLETYQTQATLCLVEILEFVVPQVARCNATAERNQIAINVVSTGNNPDGTGSAMVMQTIADYKILNTVPDAPLLAAGVIGGSGTFDVVANPNGGGLGVPLSAWSNFDVDLSGGTAKTCHLHEYLATGTPYEIGTDPVITVCDNCACQVSDSLSYNSAGSNKEGVDILDRDGNQGQTPDAVNFPDDVFAYIFGVPNAEWKQVYEEAEVIPDCSTLNADSRGLHWVTGPCSISVDVGTPDFPVTLVAESDVQIQSGANYFGLVFAWGGELGGAGGSVQMRGGVRFYGAIISDHDIDMGNGTYQMIFNEDILKNLKKDEFRFGLVPGTYRDFL